MSDRRLTASGLTSLQACPGFYEQHGKTLVQPTSPTLGVRDALLSMFDGDENEIDPAIERHLSVSEIEAAKWAHERIQFHAPLDDYPLETNTPVLIEPLLWPGLSGVIDYRCGDTFFVFRWLDRDITPELAALALGLMNLRLTEFATCWVLFGSTQREFKIEYPYDIALQIVSNTIEKAWTLDELNPGEQCSECEKHLTCIAVVGEVNSVLEDEDPDMEPIEKNLEGDAYARARGLRTSRIVARWAKAYESRAKTMAMQGSEFPGFELVSRNGKLEITDIQEAFQQSGLSEQEFMECCEASFNDIAEARARKHSIPLESSKRELKRILNGTYQQSETTYYLKETK